MLPGYGLSPLPDFQPHLQPFSCRHSPRMWIPGSTDPQSLSEGQEDRALLHCHHKHVAVCQQETLAFIELPPAVSPKLNGLSSQRTVNRFKHCLNEVNQRQNRHTTYSEQSVHLNGHTDKEECNHLTHSEHFCQNNGESATGQTDRLHTVTTACPPLLCHTDTEELHNHTNSELFLHEDPELLCHEDGEPAPGQTDSPRAVTTVCRPLFSALSLPLSFPLSSLYSSTHSWDSEAPPSPEALEPCTPQRRTSQGSLKEKSIRRKMQVYSPDSPTEECVSPLLDPDFLFPGPFASFLEEDLSLSSLETLTSPSSCDSGTEDIFNLPEEPLHIIEDPIPDVPEENGVEMSTATAGSSLSRRGEERRRFSASELISRLQLSQRKNSFTLKLGKSLSARVSSRDRQSNGFSPSTDCASTQ